MVSIMLPSDEDAQPIGGPMTVDEVAESAMALVVKLKALRELLDTHKAILRHAVEQSGKKSGIFGNVEVRLKPQTAVACACHEYHVKVCPFLDITEVQVKTIEVSRYVHLDYVEDPA